MPPFKVATIAALAIILTQGQALNPVDPNAKAAYFVTNTSGSSQYVFALNAVDNGDIYFHMNAPTTHSWMGVGIGENMPGAFMLVSYVSANGSGVTTSPRFADGHSEPSYLDSVTVEGIYSDAYAPNANAVTSDGLTMISHCVCRNCSALSSLDMTSTAQPFIFALGPERKLHSDERDAPLRRHDYYGHFTMDMTKASSSVSGRVPAPNINDTAATPDSDFADASASLAFATNSDRDVVLAVHGFVMCVAFVLVFPIGALLLRLLKSVLWHAVAQTLGAILVIAGFGSAIYISKEYNRSKHFSTAHQGIGLLVFVATLMQLGLGLSHHLIFRRTQKPTVLGKVHLFLGPAVMLLALINGGLGFNLAGNSHFNTAYAIVVLIIGILFVAIRAWVVFGRRPRAYKPDRESIDEYQFPQANYTVGTRTPSFRTTYQPTTPRAGHFSEGSELRDRELFLPPQRPDLTVQPPKLTVNTRSGYDRLGHESVDTRYA